MARTVHSRKSVEHSCGFGSNKLKEIIIPADIEAEILQYAKTSRIKKELTPEQLAVVRKMKAMGFGCPSISKFINDKYGLGIGRSFIEARLKYV